MQTPPAAEPAARDALGAARHIVRQELSDLDINHFLTFRAHQNLLSAVQTLRTHLQTNGRQQAAELLVMIDLMAIGLLKARQALHKPGLQLLSQAVDAVDELVTTGSVRPHHNRQIVEEIWAWIDHSGAAPDATPENSSQNLRK